MDVVVFSNEFKAVITELPKELQVQNISDSKGEDVRGWRRLYFVNKLLLFCPEERKGEIEGRIVSAREAYLSAEFFDGGVGESITYAAYKVISNKEERYLDHRTRETVLGKNFVVCHSDWDGLPLSPPEFHKEVRDRLGETFDLEELREIGLAASRRIRIKEERRNEFSNRFAQEIVKRAQNRIKG